MPAPVTVLQILSRQTRQDTLDCESCEGRGERLLFDPETGSDYQLCEACQGTGYNLLGLLVHGLLRPPESGYGPQELKETLKQLTQRQQTLSADKVKSPDLQITNPNQSVNPQPTLELQYGH